MGRSKSIPRVQNALIAAVREPGSMCHDSGLVLIAEESDLAEAIPWMGQGVNRIVMLEWSRSRIWQTIDELLSVAPRLKIDVPVQIALPDDIEDRLEKSSDYKGWSFR
jgi:hypothetical protein